MFSKGRTAIAGGFSVEEFCSFLASPAGQFDLAGVLRSSAGGLGGNSKTPFASTLLVPWFSLLSAFYPFFPLCPSFPPFSFLFPKSFT